ncbi:hypothetical protein F2Q70_00022102 [Brassica cretica]|uniref:Uncharacterized protein n=1 Tax=Brassica cretica TaxID=69181 RepID=A0A8S9GU92_BRACR|nr:hypothetical protein F2Q70_00022102 [Brassica cretica]
MSVKIKNDPEVSIKISKDLRKADVDHHRWSGTGLCGPRVEIIGTKDWKSGVLAKDLLGEQETTRRNRVGLLRHNSSDTVCSGVYGNREFPERDSLSSRVLS